MITDKVSKMFNIQKPIKAEFVTNYKMMLDEYLISNTHSNEIDFINNCLFEFDELIKVPKSILADPSLIFKNELKYKEASPFFIKRIKNTNKETIKEIQNIKTFLEDKRTFEPHQIKEKKSIKKNEPETLSNLITHEKSVEIVKKIKHHYPSIKGKTIKILLKVLQDLDLMSSEPNLSAFHKSCENEFNNIGSFEAFRKHEFNTSKNSADNIIFEEMKTHINTITSIK